jgi:hypothetical protein
MLASELQALVGPAPTASNVDGGVRRGYPSLIDEARPRPEPMTETLRVLVRGSRVRCGEPDGPRPRSRRFAAHEIASAIVGTGGSGNAAANLLRG